MNRFLPLALSLIAGGCASTQVTRAVQEPVKPIPGLIHLIGRFGLAHACAIASDRAVTAAHAVDERPFDPSVALYPMRWSADSGESGVAFPLLVARERDLGFVRTLEPFPTVAPLSKVAPKAGDRVSVTGYDWRTRNQTAANRTWQGKVLRVVADTVFLDVAADQGTSGSCVLNEAGETIGVYVWIMPTKAGVAVGLWGSLSEMPAVQDPDVIPLLRFLGE